MNALSTEVEVQVPATPTPTVRRQYNRRITPRNANPNVIRPAHAVASPADQPVPRVPHNVSCPVCRASAGSPCTGRRQQGRSTPSFAHPERRVLAGKARRRQVYGSPRHPDAYGWDGGVALVVDSLPERG